MDVNDTSGFFPGQTNGIVVIYTLNTPLEQSQHIAYSYDSGYTFTKYVQNPVLSINSTQFRDPQVSWHAPTQSWVMVVALSRQLTIRVYTSLNLISWKHASDYTHSGFQHLQWECPALILIPTIPASLCFGLHSPANFTWTSTEFDYFYILVVSLNPGYLLGGSTTNISLPIQPDAFLSCR